MQNAAHKYLREEIDFLKSILSLRDEALSARDAEIANHAAEIAYQEARFALLLEQIRLLRHKFYAASSEQASGQIALFDEAEVLAAEPAEDEDVAPIVTDAPAACRYRS